ncbi:flagellar motor protein MotB [Acidaminobacter sp. JC074]|uniref:OmpA/MotB family protein n=1 Tax=Acidaminobacter sp. JC074 TaxID=2530199 RepID=UPI001F111285|nr:flagellar motor protein MotB [Acidaminobacter sp. JC074]MCH4888729.1 flagellar motor protein MotB [Acidaminobacter sp. JC074]
MDKKCPECKGGAPEWMVTYGDLVTLLMCFFVLLFAFSEIDAQKFEAVMQSFQGSAGVLEGGKSISEDPLVFDASPENDTTPETTEAEKLEVINEILNQLKGEIEEEFEKKGMVGELQFELEADTLKIILDDSVLYDPASAELKEESYEVLTILGETFKNELFELGNFRIDGHTDNVPINTLRYPSNWELSTARATSVLRFFRDELSFAENRFVIAGYSDTRPRATNDTPEGRAQNRRVEFIIENIDLGSTTDGAETPVTEGE